MPSPASSRGEAWSELEVDSFQLARHRVKRRPGRQKGGLLGPTRLKRCCGEREKGARNKARGRPGASLRLR